MCDHYSKVIKKASTRVNLLKRMRCYINSRTATIIYKSMIIPTLTYCPLVTSCVSNTLLDRVATVETRARRIINCHKLTSNIPSVNTIFKKQCCTYVFRILNSDVCDNFKNYFQTIVSQHETRNNGRLVRLPKVRLEAARKAFFFNGGRIFNKLPINIRNSNDLKSFKLLLKKHEFLQ